jgi:hypothetical protein
MKVDVQTVEAIGPREAFRAAARELGVTRQEAQRAITIAAIEPEAREAARQAGLDDTQSALLPSSPQVRARRPL